MSEKRFYSMFDGECFQLLDNDDTTFYPIHDSGRNVNLFCEKLNKLVEENEQLKREMEEFKEVIIDKVQYGEDNLEEFLIKKGIISEDWARFDGYD